MSDLRRQILSIATQLFIRQGYHGLSMRQIAEALGVSKAALYYYFKDKEELLLAILDTYLDEMEAALQQIKQSHHGARPRIEALITLILSQPDEQRAVIRLSSQEMAHLSMPARQNFERSYRQKFLDRIQSILDEGMQTGELKPIDPHIATWALLGIMYPYFYPAHSAELSATHAVAGQLAMIFLRGLEQ